LRDDAWVDGDRLILPWFDESRASTQNLLVAIDLASGRTAWRLDFSSPGVEPRALNAILQSGAKTYLLVSPVPDAQRTAPMRTVLELSTAIGAATPLSNIRVGWDDRILGLPPDSRTRLASPWVFLLSGLRPGARELRLRAVDLASGEVWTQTLGNVLASEIQRAQIEPAVSDSTVAVSLALTPSPQLRSPARASQLWLFDRASGLPRGNYEPDSVQLVALGKSLFLRGRNALEAWQ
jgi:hypothetical protein